jgi:hypothetical protein
VEAVKADNYAYEPGQEYDAKAGHLHAWLPHPNRGEHDSAVRRTLTDPAISEPSRAWP